MRSKAIANYCGTEEPAVSAEPQFSGSARALDGAMFVVGSRPEAVGRDVAKFKNWPFAETPEKLRENARLAGAIARRAGSIGQSYANDAAHTV